MSKRHVKELLDKRNPDAVKHVKSIIGEEAAALFDHMRYNFNDFFADLAVARDSYKGMTVADNEEIFQWREDVFLEAVEQWKKELSNEK